MIDWYSVFANFLWIFALALALASLSFAYWEATVRNVKLRINLKHPRWQRLFNISGALFCLGLAGTSDATWEVAIWLVLMALFIIQLVTGYISHRNA